MCAVPCPLSEKGTDLTSSRTLQFRSEPRHAPSCVCLSAKPDCRCTAAPANLEFLDLGQSLQLDVLHFWCAWSGPGLACFSGYQPMNTKCHAQE